MPYPEIGSYFSQSLNLTTFIEKTDIPSNYVIATMKHTLRVYCGTINFTLIQTDIQKK